MSELVEDTGLGLKKPEPQLPKYKMKLILMIYNGNDSFRYCSDGRWSNI